MDCSEILTGEFEYELIDISWSLDYDFGSMPHATHVADEGEIEPQKSDGSSPLDMDEDGIAKGDDLKAIEQRREAIRRFWYKLKEKYKDPAKSRILNEALNEYIYLRQISFEEAKAHSALHYNSTKAFLRIEEVLQKARPVARVPKKTDDKNQMDFECLLIMVFEFTDIGRIKLTVGLRHRNKANEIHQKVEYAVTALDKDAKLISKEPQKKRKAPHRRR